MRVNFKKIGTELKRRGFFSFVKKIEKAESKAEIYLVGGAVRDLIMGRQTTDFDFVVRNVSAKKLEKILAKLGKVNFVGKTFGVFKLVIKNGPNEIDIALPRTDYAFGTGGRKDFKIKYDPKLPIEKDLSRRDFTINAMAMCLTNNQSPVNNNQIIDPFNGLKDLNKKIIRTVGKPADRFQEDYSRMLRAIRIACELDHSAQGGPASGWKIERKTWLAIKKYIKHLNDTKGQVRIVPHEVIAKEFLKTFKAKAGEAFQKFDQASVFKTLIPEIEKMKKCPQPKQFHAEGDVFIHTKMALDEFSSAKYKKEFGKEISSLNLIIAVLLHDIGKPPTTKTPEKHGVDRVRSDNHDTVGAKMAEEIIARLKLTSPPEIGLEPKKISWLIKNHMVMLHMKNKLREVKPSTLERYFFNPEMPSQDLLKLIFVDISAGRPAKVWQPIFKDYYQLKRKIEQLEKISKKKKVLPPPLLNGHEIMKILKIKPSPLIGKIKDGLREAQLTKKIKDIKEAQSFIQEKYGNRA